MGDDLHDQPTGHYIGSADFVDVAALQFGKERGLVAHGLVCAGMAVSSTISFWKRGSFRSGSGRSSAGVSSTCPISSRRLPSDSGTTPLSLQGSQATRDYFPPSKIRRRVVFARGRRRCGPRFERLRNRTCRVAGTTTPSSPASCGTTRAFPKRKASDNARPRRLRRNPDPVQAPILWVLLVAEFLEARIRIAARMALRRFSSAKKLDGLITR